MSETRPLAGRTAIVTGASSGTGQAIARVNVAEVVVRPARQISL